MPDSSSRLTFSLSDVEIVMEERQERMEGIEEVEMEFLSFLNGRAMAFAPLFTDCLRDAALPEIEDLVELVSIEFAIMQNGLQ
jgi:hypothetical protein